LCPPLLDLFSFSKTKNLLESQEFKQHATKVCQVFDKIIQNLGRMDKLVPSLEKLGKDHKPFQVESEHYSAFGTAFIRTIEDKLGCEFSVDLRKNWEILFTIIQSCMLGQAAG